MCGVTNLVASRFVIPDEIQLLTDECKNFNGGLIRNDWEFTRYTSTLGSVRLYSNIREG